MNVSSEEAILRTLSSPRRREILRLVWTSEASAGDIRRAMPDVTFGAVSQQLRAMLDEGLVEMRGDSRFRYYRARREAFGPIGTLLESMWDGALGRLKAAAEIEQARRGPRSRPATKKAGTNKARSQSKTPNQAKKRTQ